MIYLSNLKERNVSSWNPRHKGASLCRYGIKKSACAESSITAAGPSTCKHTLYDSYYLVITVISLPEYLIKSLCLLYVLLGIDILKVRTQIQAEAMQSGLAMQHLDALLLELGRTMLTLRIGQYEEDDD
ncbi:hypothetical protein L1987_46997 [Smallanthus sonchifolius]|uniref:Uncharacterized protein n=1 Tax=Smallanthus sonchifolius TaxID=185202 RepID=A0ACB9G1V5_9ASTR|nr:hypothetical protein L1987_46997 [Smallanthus sonchifolius]